jgi:hypothetical protein
MFRGQEVPTEAPAPTAAATSAATATPMPTSAPRRPAILFGIASRRQARLLWVYLPTTLPSLSWPTIFPSRAMTWP